MANDHSTSTNAAAARELPYRGRLAPPYTAVLVRVYEWRRGSLHIRYRGSREDLIACGAVTAKLLAPRRSGNQNSFRRDDAGKRVAITRRGKRIEVIRLRDTDASGTALPGLERWMYEAVQTHEAECTARPPEQGLSPDDWRERLVDLVAASLNGVESVVADSADRDSLTLSPGYFADVTDVETYALANAKAIAELSALLRSMRIRRRCRLQLVVDNSRPGAQS